MKFRDIPKDVILYKIIPMWRQNNIYETLKMLYSYKRFLYNKNHNKIENYKYLNIYITMYIFNINVKFKKSGLNEEVWYGYERSKKIIKRIIENRKFYKDNDIFNYKSLDDILKKKGIKKFGEYYKLTGLELVEYEFNLEPKYEKKYVKKLIRKLRKRSKFDDKTLTEKIRLKYFFSNIKK